MIVLHIDERHVIVFRFDARLASQNGELRAAPVDDGLAADVAIENVSIVAELARPVFGLDEKRYRVVGTFGPNM